MVSLLRRCQAIDSSDFLLFFNRPGSMSVNAYGNFWIDGNGDKTSKVKIWEPMREKSKRLYELKKQYPSYFGTMKEYGVRFTNQDLENYLIGINKGLKDLEGLDAYYETLDSLDLDEFEYHLRNLSKE